MCIYISLSLSIYIYIYMRSGSEAIKYIMRLSIL